MANSLPPIRFHPPRIRLDSAAMRKLYHHWLSPFSRKVRILLKEKGLDFQLEVEKTWERREDFLALNPAGLVPVLVEHDGHVLAESQAIRSEERRVGKEGVSTGRSRWSPVR